VCLESFPAAIIITLDNNNNKKKKIARFFSFISYNKSRYSGDGTYCTDAAYYAGEAYTFMSSSAEN